MQKTPFNTHLFLQIGQSLPLNYFNPPKDADLIVCFKGLPGAEAIDYINYIFRRKMGGWVLEAIE